MPLTIAGGLSCLRLRAKYLLYPQLRGFLFKAKLFTLNRVSKVNSLAKQAKRLQEQWDLVRAYKQLKAWEEIVISSDDDEELSRQIRASSAFGPSTSKTGGAN